MGDYPEHEKLAAVKSESQAIGEFMDWLADDGVFLYKTNPDVYEPGDDCYPLQRPIRDLLHEFFNIDANKIEAEKRAMLKLLREANLADRQAAETIETKGEVL
jgi:hypothetical protein